MKIIYLIVFLSCAFAAKAQPVPEVTVKDNTNLNDISADLIEKCFKANFCSVGTIVIDEKTDLKNIGKLQKFKYLSLDIHLSFFPIINRAESWETEVLQIDGNYILEDISNINSLVKLKILSISNFNGKKLSNSNLKLENLNILHLTDSPYLEEIDAISKLKQIKELNVSSKNSIKIFPKFIEKNKVQKLYVETDANLENLKHLKNLKKLYLKTKIDSIPDFLPKNIEELIINGRNESVLKNISSLNKYTALKVFRFGNLKIEDNFSTFPKIELDYLNFGGKDVGNINFIFKFKKIKHLDIYDLDGADELDSSNSSTIFEDIKILSLKNLKLDKLLEAPIKNSLSIMYSDIEHLPNLNVLKKIPNLLIENNSMLLQSDYIQSGNWKIINNGN